MLQGNGTTNGMELVPAAQVERYTSWKGLAIIVEQCHWPYTRINNKYVNVRKKFKCLA